MGSQGLAFHAFLGPAFPQLFDFLRSFSSFFLFVHSPAESVGFRASLQNVCPIGDAIQQCLAQPRIWNYLRPLGKRQIGSQNHGGSFGPFGNHLKQKLCADFSQWHISDFVD